MRCMFYLTVITTTPFKNIKAIDNIKLGTGNKLQELKLLLSDGSLKSLDIFGK